LPRPEEGKRKEEERKKKNHWVSGRRVRRPSAPAGWALAPRKGKKGRRAAETVDRVSRHLMERGGPAEETAQRGGKKKEGDLIIPKPVT